MDVWVAQRIVERLLHILEITLATCIHIHIDISIQIIFVRFDVFELCSFELAINKALNFPIF